MNAVRSTTVLAVRRRGEVVMAADGQITFQNTILKQGARKVRTLYEGRVLAGFAGGSADALTLFEKFEGKLNEYSGSLLRAAVELAKEWRTDRLLRRLEAMLLVADSQKTLLISGTGDVIEPDGEAMAIGSGGPYALAAARALLVHSGLDAEEIAKEALRIASQICVFTNEQIVLEKLAGVPSAQAEVTK